MGGGREGILQDVVEAERLRVFGGGDGDQMERALGAGHGDVEQAQFFEGFALAVGGQLRGERRFGIDDVRFGRGQDPVHGRIGFAALPLADEERRLAHGGDALVAEGGENDDVELEPFGLVHGEDLDVGAGFLGGDFLGLHVGNELEGVAVGLAVEFGGDGDERAQAALFQGRPGQIQRGGKPRDESGVALFADQAGLGGERGRRERDPARQRRHFDMAPGEFVAGMFRELGVGENGRDERVVEQRGIAGPDGADAAFRQGVEQGQAVGVAAREERDGTPVEIGDVLPEFGDEVGGAGDGRRAFFVRFQPRQHVERDVAGQAFVFRGGGVGLPFGGPAGGDGLPIGREVFVAGQRQGGQVAKHIVYGFEDVWAGTPGADQRFGLLDGDVARPVVLGEDAPEQARVAAAPLVDGLLDVADVEQRAVAVGILDDLVEEVFDDGPLDEGGVLEFVEQPVQIAGVETAFQQGAPAGGDRPGGGREQLGNVVEGELAGAGDVRAVLAAVGGEEAMEPLRADDLPGEGRVADIGERGGQRGLGFREQGDRAAAERDGCAVAAGRDESGVEAIVQLGAEFVVAAVLHAAEHGRELVPRLPVAGRAEGVGLRVEGGEDGGPVGRRGRRKQGRAVFPDAGGVAPGGPVRRALVEFVLVLDEACDGAVHALLFLAERGELEGLHHLAALGGGKRGAFEQALEDEVFLGIVGLRRDRQFGADAGFEAERPEDLEKEGIERADAQPRQGMDEAAERGLRGGGIGEAGEVRPGEFLAQAAIPLFGSGGAGEAGQDAREDFAGGLAGESERDDGGGIGAGGEQRQIAAAEGEGLARAGGGGQGRVADGHRRGHRSGSAMSGGSPAKSQAKSSRSSGKMAGGQNMPARIAATTARAAASADG